MCAPACGSTQLCNSACSCVDLPPVVELGRDSRSSTVDINVQDTVVAAANRDHGSVSFLNTTTNTVASRVTVPDPRSVVFSPSGSVVYVSASDGIHRITGADSLSPVLGPALAACAEPQGIALLPSGNRLVVACLEGVVVWVDTSSASLSVTATVNLRGALAQHGGTLPPNAAAVAVAVTNNRDGQDADERIVVPLFYDEPVDVAGPADVDVAGVGVVAVLSADGSLTHRIDLLPEADTGFGAGAFMNQLSNVWVQGDRAYVLALAAGPKGAPGPAAGNSNPDAGPIVVAGSQNTLPFFITLDLATGTELHRINLNAEMRAKAGAIRFFSVLSGLAFVPGTNIVYVTSIASDALVRMKVNADGSLAPDGGSNGFGSALNNFIPLDKAPSGVTISHGVSGFKGYVVNDVSRSVQVVTFATQAVSATVESAPLPAVGSTEEKVLAGKRFFFTSTARWGNNGMVGCLACHPGQGALSDNVTWYFAAGPRQTVALDAMFGKVGDSASGAPNPLDARVLNWTAIFDEMHDFELNVRGVSAGVGAIVTDPALDLAKRVNLATAGPGGAPAQFLRNSAKVIVCDVSVNKDWDAIELFSQGLRTPASPQTNATAIARGRLLFDQGGTGAPEGGRCTLCHAGSKWTVSRLPYDPADNTGGTLAAERARAVTYTGGAFNQDTTVIAADDVPDGTGVPVPKLDRVACVLRRVGTFDASSAFEVRQNMAAGNTAQGARGFNPPSLLGVRYGSPYLHGGTVRTLTELFSPAFDAHTTAGNPNFLANANTRTQDVADLVAFLESIDDTTEVFPIPAGAILCPATIP